MMAKDFFGNEIIIGKRAAFFQVQYRNLMVGTVKKITPQTVLIAHKRTNIGQTETRQRHAQIIMCEQLIGDY